jgi:CheY-like chemotaxis protein
MTAQNMGKKILSEAGYEVVAVSNGAAAVKKIAEQKPDIIILDVYMPGYTGLEVCEKVRGSIDTLKTPVLLTVGKLEPYKPEDANRVKADGVIIKPFEASDLLAIVKKFEERIGSAAPPIAPQQAAVVERTYAEEEPAPVEAPVETQSSGSRPGMQPMVEVPDHMASSAAFGDLLGSEPASTPTHFAVNTPSAAFETSVIVPAPPIVVAEQETAVLPKVEEEPVVAAPAGPSPEAVIPELDASPEVTVTPVEIAPPTASEAAPVQQERAPEPAAVQPGPVAQPGPVSEVPHAQFIPVFKDPEPPAAQYDFVPTAVPAVDDVEIPREPALQETAEETTRNTVADHVEPGLMPVIEQIQPEPASAPAAAEASSFPSSVAEIPIGVSDADFEARVAAAMAAYNQTSEAETAHAEATEAHETAAAETHEVAPAPAAAQEAPVAQEDAPAAQEEKIPSFEYQPPVRSVEPEITHEPAAQVEVPAATHEDHAAVAAGVEMAIPEAAAAVAADSGADHHTIAQAVHRVMERLKPELVEEILKELKSKK